MFGYLQVSSGMFGYVRVCSGIFGYISVPSKKRKRQWLLFRGPMSFLKQLYLVPNNNIFANNFIPMKFHTS